MREQVSPRAADFASLRRRLAFGIVGGALTMTIAKAAASDPPTPTASAAEPVEGLSKDEWLDRYFAEKDWGGPLSTARFLDRMYYLTKDLSWSATGSSAPLGRITVPSGFVTDFASVPRVFWSVLPPDGDYVAAAVVHDWLYWDQTTTREAADQALRDAMVELQIPSAAVWAVYNGVNLFGSSAWTANNRLKAAGERRVLAKMPTDLREKWVDYRLKPDVFR